MKIIVTGGAGFIGSFLCERLIKDNHNVICIDNFSTGSKNNLNNIINNKRFELLEHDVTFPLRENTNCQAIFHLASPASPNHHSPKSYHALAMETMLVNSTGTLEMLKLAEKNQATFLFASTSEVYGDPEKHPQSEDYNGNVSTIGPRSVYDEAKRFGETLTTYFFRKRKIDTRIARIFNTYGPRMAKDDMRMIINFINQAISGEPLTIFGNGKQTRSLCYIDDTVEGLVKLMFSSQAVGNVINIGSSEEFSVLDYAKKIISLIKSKSKIEFSEALPKDDPKRRRADITKALKILNWSPQITLEQGLKKMINYYQL